MKKHPLLIAFLIGTIGVFAQTPNVTIWLLNNTGELAMYYEADYDTVFMTDSANAQEICYNTDTIYVRVSCLAAYTMGS